MKKIVVVFVNSGMGEIDWILPVLDRLSKDHKIFTYFRNKKSYASLKNNANLYQSWIRINNFCFVERIYHNFFFKVIKKINIFFTLNNLNHYLNNKINNTKIIENIINKKIPINKYVIKFIFSDFQENFLFLENFKNIKKNRPLIIHYPHTPLAHIKTDNIKSTQNLSGDMLLVSRKGDGSFFANSIDKKKIIPVGIPRFDKWWVNKNFLLYKNQLDFGYSLKEIKKKFVITVAYDSRFDVKRFENKIKELTKELVDLMDIVSKISNVVIIFKLHPKRNSPKFKHILNQYDKNIWRVSKMHLSRLASLSNCFICSGAGGASYEALNFKVPLIQLPKIDGVDRQHNSLEKLGLTNVSKDKNDLSRLIKLSKNKKNILWKTQQENFRLNYPNNKSSIKVLTIINKAQKLNKN